MSRGENKYNVKENYNAKTSRFHLLENDIYIAGIGQAVLELLVARGLPRDT